MESGQESASAKAETGGPAKVEGSGLGPIRHLKRTWLLLSPEKKRKLLTEFEAAYDNEPENGFGSELQSDAALNWVVLRLRGRRSWRSCSDILDRLREKLTLVYRSQEPFKSAIERLGKDASKVEPKEVLKEIKKTDKNAYNRLGVRQDAAFRAFYKWAKKKSLDLAPYILVLLVLLRLGRLKKAAATTVAIVGISFLAWCGLQSRARDSVLEGNSANRGSSEGAGLSDQSATQRAEANSRTEGNQSPTSVEKQRVGLNDIEELQDAPYFRLRLLSQSMTVERQTAQAPEIPRQGWWDFSELTPVPPDYADQWRRIQELDRRAAQASRAGQHMGALSTYQELARLKSADCQGRSELEAKQSPDNGRLRSALDEKNEASSSSKSPKTCWLPTTLGQDVDFYILTVLKRLAGKGEIPLFASPFDGPSALGLMQYEIGRGYEEHMDLQRALERYGAAIWRSFAMPESVQRMQAENLAKSNWGHLVDLMQMPQDARARARRIAETGLAEQAVVIRDDMALWFHDNNLVAVSLEPKVPIVCKAIDKGPGDPVYHFGEPWQISTDYDGAAVLQEDRTIPNSGIVRRPVSLPSVRARKTLVVHWRLKSADRGRAACSDITTTLDFCFWPDGHLTDVQACP